MRGRTALSLLASAFFAVATEAATEDGCAANTTFLVGAGIYDITGPAAERGMMGYAQIAQQTGGIHLRLRSRAFIVASACNGERVALVAADLGKVFQAVKQQVVKKQHYEGASTHFGPWTLAGIQQEVDRLAAALASGAPADPGPTPRDLSCCQVDLQPGVVFDDKPLFKSFGSLYRDASPSYRTGETVRVVFWGAHPKNNLRIQGTFLEIQKLTSASWIPIATDGDPETKHIWERSFMATSHVTVEWKVPPDTPPGTYCVRHYGDWRSGWDGKIRPYNGTSRSFTVR